MSNLEDEITDAINRNSAENGSNTPDLILGEYLTACLAAFNQATNAREKWYGRDVTRGPIGVVAVDDASPKAEKCPECNGHGIVQTSDNGAMQVYDDCPKCAPKAEKKENE